MSDEKRIIRALEVFKASDNNFSSMVGYKNKDYLALLLTSAKKSDIELIDVGCVSTKPNFNDVSQEEEFNRLNFFLDNYEGNFKLSIDNNKNFFHIPGYAFPVNF